ncbi:hypothetical protein ACWWUQ_04840 [Corynebacterium striatum]|nr:hypothetical protein [Corynebacterium striatum]HAT1392283.1 hypothetical protein [Corynebacterium striatum]HAT6625081.1 hypothetical protein [Corynebacterium striatum]HAT6634363.1 hypothetical protein [Corynebacterium striatum]
MNVDQEDLAQAAKHLRVLYEELNQAKYDRPPAPEVSTKHSNRQKGPMDPAPIWTLSDDEHFTKRLNQMVCDAAGRIEGNHKPTLDGRQLADWLAWHAGPVSQLDFADDILDEVRWQIRELDHRLRRTRPPEPIGEPKEVWLTARTVCYRLRQQGYAITPALLRKWAERRKIESKVSALGKVTYPLRNVIRILENGYGIHSGQA